MEHTITLTTEELWLLRQHLALLKPTNYNPHTFSVIRGLYSKLDHVLLHLRADAFFAPSFTVSMKKGG